MSSRLLTHLILPAALLVTAVFNPSAPAEVQSRITSVVTNANRVPVPGTVMTRVQRAVDLGAVPAGKRLDSMSLRFSMTNAQQADLTQLLAAQLNPSSPSYHKWLTSQQVGARFGLSSADIAKVSAWLTSQGFTVTGTANTATFVRFSGTVAQVQQAFGISIHNLSVDGEQHFSNTADPNVPSAIGSVVTSITGLNDFRPRPHSRGHSVSIDSSQPLFTQTAGSTTSHFISPADFHTIYDMNPLLTASTPINGAGVTIAVMGQTALTLTSGSDPSITSFRSAAGLPPINLQLLVAGTDPGVQQDGDIDEAHIDLEWSGAAAPGATILYVYGEDVINDSLTAAIDNKVAPIITISFGNCESIANLSSGGQSPLVGINELLALANAEGITVMSSAGDSGATDCEALGGIASGGLAVDFPTSSPFVTSAGGTMFSGDVTAPATYWNASNGTGGGSAIQYIPEQPWDETTAANGLDAGGAGGGGASAFFSKPSWQMGTGSGATPNDSSRDVPDISLNAAAIHDGYLVCSQNDGNTNEPVCANNSFLSSSGAANVFGGTSIVAPSFAGILALIEQKLGVGNTGLGNINPILYGLANGPTYSTIFHDVVTGNNAVECSQGTPNCPNGGAIGFSAGPGYDQASGLGSVDVTALANAWSTAIPTGTGGSTNGGCNPSAPVVGTASCITATTLTTSSSLCAITSGSIPLTVTVNGVLSGTVPTGTVQFFIDGVAVGTPQPLVSGSASYNLVTSSATSGGHNISAVYSGDINYAGSKGTLLAADGSLASVDVVSSTTPDFSLTPCTGSATVLPGGTTPGVVFTITPFKGFIGLVSMTVTNNNLAIATPSFTVTPVNITGAGAVTTSFVITASQPTAAAVQPKFAPFQKRQSQRAPWYIAGSGATFACLLLITLPRRRRWTSLLAVVLSLAALTAVGCGGSSSSTSTTTSGGGGTGPTAPVTNAQPGTYTFTVTAVSGALVHSSQVTLTVQ